MNYARCLLAAITLTASVQTGFGQAAPANPTTTPKEEVLTLNPFVVESAKNEGYITSSATAAGRVAQQLENVPQQISIYNSDFLKDIQFTSFQDALRYDSSTNFSNSQFNSPAPIIRGFAAPDPLRNGVGGLTSANPMGVEAIEQVEVVKGAAAVLYGPSQPGGVVNYVTKRPNFHRGSSLDVQYFAEGGYKAVVDTTGPVPLKSADGRDVLAYRAVVAYEDRDLYQINDQFLRRSMFYGALTYRPTKELTIDAEYQDDHQKTSFFNSSLNTQVTITGIANGSIPPKQVQLPYDIFPGGASWTYQDTYGFSDQHHQYAQLSAVLTHDFGKFGSWALRANYTWSQSTVTRLLDDISGGNFPQPVTAANLGQTVNFTQTVGTSDVSAGRLWIPARYIRRIEDYPVARLKTQWDLTGKFKTGKLDHTFLIGTDADLGSNNQSGIAGVATVEKQAYVGAAGQINAIWVDTPDLRPISNINWNDVRNATTNPGGVVTAVVNTPTGKRVDLNNNMKFGLPWFTIPEGGNYDKNVYFFDAISLLDDRLQISLGARYDEIGQYLAPTQFTANHWTYRYGAVYKLRPDIHLFALHNESFLPNSVAASQAFGYFVKPQQGKHDEAGLRVSLLDKKVLLSASVYKITSENVVQNNPFGNVGVVPPIPANNFAFVPGITNKGFDFDATLNITRNTQVIASYAHYDITNAAGPAQIAQGITEFPVNNVPQDQFSVWARYSVPAQALRGLSFVGGYRYVGKRSAGSIGGLPVLYLDAYGITDLGASYEKNRWSVSLLVRNVFDKYTFRTATSSSRLYPEEPREAILSLKVKF